MRRLMLAFTLLAAPVAVDAVEVGDVVRLSSMGVGRTVTAVNWRDRETIEMTVRVMAANAAEYCRRVFGLSEASPKWSTCIQEGLSPAEQIVVNCRTATIFLEGHGGGAYRRGVKGGPWVSVANPDWVIQGEGLFGTACRRR